ncbi:hypothetical protein TNCV_1721091 [Trichonephila clavipes]|nr:hypothetical protein TNCV_1721091 [Trichonephila clavipes]
MSSPLHGIRRPTVAVCCIVWGIILLLPSSSLTAWQDEYRPRVRSNVPPHWSGSRIRIRRYFCRVVNWNPDANRDLPGLMHVKSLETQSPQVGMVWFGERCANSNVILCTRFWFKIMTHIANSL